MGSFLNLNLAESDNDPVPMAQEKSRSSFLLADMAVGLMEANPIQVIGNKLKQQGIEHTSMLAGDKRLAPEELNQMFPKMTKPFDEPLFEKEAKFLHDLDSRKQSYKKVRDDNSAGDVTDTLWGFGTGVAQSLLDPVSMAVGGAVTKGFYFAAARALGTGVIPKAIASGAGKHLFDIASNVAGNLAVDAGVVYPISNSMNQDVDYHQVVQNSVIGGVVGPYLIKGVTKVISTPFKFLFGDVDKAARALDTTENAVSQGKVVSGDDLAKAEIYAKKLDLEAERAEILSDPARVEAEATRLQEIDETLDYVKDFDPEQQVKDLNSDTNDVGHIKGEQEVEALQGITEDALDLDKQIAEFDQFKKTYYDQVKGFLEPEDLKELDEAFKSTEKLGELKKALEEMTNCMR